MTNRLPELFLNNYSTIQPVVMKKQGGIFQLNLSQPFPADMNATYTSGFRSKHNKTSIEKRAKNDCKSLYRTLPLRVNRYEVSKDKKFINDRQSAFRSVKAKVFSLQKNPQTCHSYHDNQEADNINSIIQNRKQEIAQISFKMTPFAFFATQYRQNLQKMRRRLDQQIEQMEFQMSSGIQNLKNQVSLLRRQTKNQIKKNKLELEKYNDELRVYQELAQDYPERMEKLKSAF